MSNTANWSESKDEGGADEQMEEKKDFCVGKAKSNSKHDGVGLDFHPSTEL